MIAVAYLFAAYALGGGEFAFRMWIYLILPLACIWFSDAMGRHTGPYSLSFWITKTTPGGFVAFGGWVLLLLPGIFLLVAYFTRGD